MSPVMGKNVHLSFISRLTRTKPLETVKEKEKLARVLTTLDLTALGVGSTLGVGIYILAGAISKTVAGPSVVAGFLIAAVASTFAGLCFAEVASVIPTDGAAYSYTYVAVGELAGFAAGWILILQYFMAAATVSKGFSGYTDYLIGNKIRNTLRDVLPIDVPILGPYPDFFAVGIITLASVILFLGVRDTSRFNKAFTVMNLSVVTYVIVCGAFKADINNWRIEKEDIPEEYREEAGEGGFCPFGFSGLMAGAAECLVGFVGFEVIATTGEEAINPWRSIPISIIVSLFFVTVGYSGISAVLTLMWPYYLQDTYAPIPHVFHEIGWDVAMWIVNVGAFFGISTGLLGVLFPIPRVIYSMADDGLLFRKLAYVSPKTQTPVYATIVACLLASCMGALLDLDELVAIVSLATLPAFIFVAASLLVLRYREEKTAENEGSRQTIHDHYSCNEVFLRILNLKKLRKPNRLSTMVSSWGVFVFCILTVCLCAAAIFTESDLMDGELYAVILVGCFGFAVLLSLVVIGIQPQSQGSDSFKVPLVPFIPACTIILNVFLMMKLPWQTWLKFGIWLVLGIIIYFAYGISESSEEYRLRGRRIPGARTGSVASSNRSIYRNRSKSRSTLSIQSSQLNAHTNQGFAHDEEAGLNDSTKQTESPVTRYYRSVSELSSGNRSIPESPAVGENEITYHSECNKINDNVAADHQETKERRGDSIEMKKQSKDKGVSENNTEIDSAELQGKADEETPTADKATVIVDSLHSGSNASGSTTNETNAELLPAKEPEDITKKDGVDTVDLSPENVIIHPETKAPIYSPCEKPNKASSAEDRYDIAAKHKVITQTESIKSPSDESIGDIGATEYLSAKEEGERFPRSTEQFFSETDNQVESKEPSAESTTQSSAKNKQLKEAPVSAESLQESTEQFIAKEESQKQSTEFTKSAGLTEQYLEMEENLEDLTKPSFTLVDNLTSEGKEFQTSPVRVRKIEQMETNPPHIPNTVSDSQLQNTETSNDKDLEPTMEDIEKTLNTGLTDTSQKPSSPANPSLPSDLPSPSLASSTEASSLPKPPFLYQLTSSESSISEELTVPVTIEQSRPSSLPKQYSSPEPSAEVSPFPSAEVSSSSETPTVESPSVSKTQPNEISTKSHQVPSPLISDPQPHDPSVSLSPVSGHLQSEASASATNDAISEPSTVQRLAQLYGGTKRASAPVINEESKRNIDRKGDSQAPSTSLPLKASSTPIKSTQYIENGGETGDIKPTTSSLLQSSSGESLSPGEPSSLVVSSSTPEEYNTTSAPVTVRQLSQLYGDTKRITTPRGDNPRQSAYSEDATKTAASVLNENSDSKPQSVKDLSRMFGGSRK